MPKVATTKSPLQSRNPKVLSKLEATGKALMKGVYRRTFGSEGRSLKVDDFVRPMQDLTKQDIEFVIPLTVVYTGMGSPDQWEAVDLEAESAVMSAIRPYFPKATLVRRTKTDPYKADPRSLTMLRYRA